MVLKPLDVLRKGLEVITNCVKSRKDVLQARLAERKSISSEDEQWLDHDANLVDEQRILEALENSPNYEEGLARLDGTQMGIVKKLCEAAGDLSKAVEKKRKHAYRTFPALQL